jgi:hypothetical protein
MYLRRKTPRILFSGAILIVIAAVLVSGSAGLANRLSQAPVLDPEAAAASQTEAEERVDPNAQVGPPEPFTPEDSDAPQATTRYLHISGSVFRTLYSSTLYSYGGSGCVYTNGGGNPYLNYALELPYDSTVTQLRLYYKDTSASADAKFWLAQYDDGLSYTYIVTATTTTRTGSGWGMTTVSLNKQLDYDNYSYALVWSQPVAGATLQLCGFRVGYTPPSIFGAALPTVRKDN